MQRHISGASEAPPSQSPAAVPPVEVALDIIARELADSADSAFSPELRRAVTAFVANARRDGLSPEGVVVRLKQSVRNYPTSFASRSEGQWAERLLRAVLDAYYGDASSPGTSDARVESHDARDR